MRRVVSSLQTMWLVHGPKHDVVFAEAIFSTGIAAVIVCFSWVRRSSLKSLGLLLVVAGWLLCLLGPAHDINLIPPEIRAGMSDTDWVGVRWLMTGMGFGLLGGVLLLVGAILDRRTAKKPS